MSKGPVFLVVDGYSRAGREDLAGGGASTAGVLYQNMLRRCAPDATVDIIYPADPGVSLPVGAELRNYDGIAWTGSSLTVYADTPEVTAQIEFARAAFTAGVPGFGSCWAAQIAAVAAGGLCAASPKGREMGIARKISLSADGRAHPMYTGKQSVFDAFISHDDEVTHLPEASMRLAGNRHCAVQALAVTYQGTEFWSVQYHPEYDLHELARLCYCRKQKLVDKGFFQDLEAAQQYVDLLEALHQNPARKDIAWLLGIDSDVTNADVRVAEVRNWVRHLVLPNMHRN